MNDKFFSLGIDLGTTSCKISLLDQYGANLGGASEGYPTESPHSGWAEQNPAGLALGSGASRAQAVCPSRAQPLSGFLHCSDQRPPTSECCWTGRMRPSETPFYGAISAPNRKPPNWIPPTARRFSAYACNRASTSWTLPHLLWVKKHEPALWGIIGPALRFPRTICSTT